MKHYQVELEDINTGACLSVDNITVDDDYTPEDYRNDCYDNGCAIPWNVNVIFVPFCDYLDRIADTLYDGGWRSEDADELKAEYGLTKKILTSYAKSSKV